MFTTFYVTLFAVCTSLQPDEYRIAVLPFLISQLLGRTKVNLVWRQCYLSIKQKLPNVSHKTTLEYAESICSNPDWEVLVAKIRPRKMNLIEKISDLLTYKVRADQCMLPCQRVPVYVSRSFLLRVLDLDQATVLNIPPKYLGSLSFHY